MYRKPGKVKGGSTGLSDWKIIYHYRPNDNPAKTRYELFNLVTDPYENENVAQSKPKVLKRMMASLTASLQAESALYPVDANGSEMHPEVP